MEGSFKKTMNSIKRNASKLSINKSRICINPGKIKKKKKYNQKSKQRFKMMTQDFHYENFIWILKLYFFMHGLSLNIIKRKCTFPLVVLIILAVFYEIASWFYCYLLITSHASREPRSVTKTVFYLLLFLTDLIQRFCLFQKDQNIINLLKKAVKIQNQSFRNNSTNLKCLLLNLIILIFIIDALKLISFFLVAHEISLQKTLLTDKKFFKDDAYKSVASLYISAFCLNWKDTSSCFTVYFMSICFLIKNILRKIKECAIKFNENNINASISLFNNVVQITKEFNDIFQILFLSTFAATLGSIFYSVFSMIENGSIGHLLFKIINLLLPFSSFMIICLSTSSLLTFGKSTRSVLQKLRNVSKRNRKKYISRIDDYTVGFTIFDSITIDKSFILSSFGVVLTYGVMIATFNQVH